VDVCLDAYGFSGPWACRRGFDSLVQMSTGIADAGMRWRQADRPVPLPVQALDHATGYVMAAAAARGVADRLRDGRGGAARLSLARTAKTLIDLGTGHEGRGELAPEARADRIETVEVTPWGEARRLRPPVSIDGADMTWSRPACELGSAPPEWL
jgi:crotonobetainyl-CoA:carnitine CoA-transferase CaiB-like acyl-CoA transferase